MVVLKLLRYVVFHETRVGLIGNSEEIFDFSSEKMTTHKTTRLKNQFCQEFSEIFQLCTEVLEKAQIESLISATLETTLRFLSWVPLGYIFGTNIVALLHERVIPSLKLALTIVL
jgi:exportin-1